MIESERYGGRRIPTVTARSGAVLAGDLRERARRSAQSPGVRTEKITDQVYSFVGASVVNRTFVIGPAGVIVYDTGVGHDDGARAYAALREITDAPVRAVLYSHNHYCYGTSGFELADDALVVGHPALNENVGSPPGFEFAGNFPEAAPVLRARFDHQFGVHLPAEGPDARWGTALAGDHGVQLAQLVNRPVSQGETLEVAGVPMQFFTDFHSDTDDQLIAWLPEQRVVLNNFLWPNMPNFAPLRGDKFRDPKSWIAALRLMRDLRPAYIVNTHGPAVIGEDACRSALNSYGDAIAYFVDQTLRGIATGLGPAELRDYVELPAALEKDPRNSESYGELSFCPPALYHHIFGWFDGVAEHIHPPTPQLAAARTVEGFGGPDAVYAAVERALEDDELTWAADLGGKLLAVAPRDESRRLLARVMRRLGQSSAGSIGRHFYLTRALELEGAIDPPGNFPYPPDVVARHALSFLEQFRIRLDPTRAGKLDRLLVVTFADSDESGGLHVRNGVCELIADLTAYGVEPDLTVTLQTRAWAELYLGKQDVATLAERGELQTSSLPDLVEFFDCFDKPG